MDVEKAKRALLRLQDAPTPGRWSADECELLNEAIDALMDDEEYARLHAELFERDEGGDSCNA